MLDACCVGDKLQRNFNDYSPYRGGWDSGFYLITTPIKQNDAE